MTDVRVRRPAARDAGFTLIELMIVLLVVAIGVLTLSGVQTSSSRDVDATGRHAHAIQLAKNQMEIARAAGYLQARPDSGAVGRLAWFTQVDSVPGASSIYGMRKVTVTVNWSEDGKPQSVRLEDLVAAR